MEQDGFSMVSLNYKIFLQFKLEQDDINVMQRMFTRSLEPDKGYSLGILRSTDEPPYMVLKLHVEPEEPCDLGDLAEDISLEMMSLTGKVKSFLTMVDLLPVEEEDEEGPEEAES